MQTGSCTNKRDVKYTSSNDAGSTERSAIIKLLNIAVPTKLSSLISLASTFLKSVCI
ncbi:hypothetical protein GCM10008107_31310 [Psychrosphaera saromensis]|nr:hypothetical protein GCM10008107_31310 [Psychrosphaera saromensis]GLQ15239.1 hypothetical protein GCM10007917_26940 [Psychrosphaera saromensis]